MLRVLLAVLALLCTSLAAIETVANQTEKSPVPDAVSSEDTATALPRSDGDLNLDIDDIDDDDEGTTTPTQETSTDTPEIPEALPVAQPLVMDVSLEDVDYMTMLRPPPPPMSPPGPRSGPRGRKKKQKRRRPLKQIPVNKGPMTQVPVNQVPLNSGPELHYHRGYPDYAEDEQWKSRKRNQEEYSLQHVDEVPYAFESIMRHVASLGEPQYQNHKSFGVDAPPSDNDADHSYHLTPTARTPPPQHQSNEPYQLNQPYKLNEPPIQHSPPAQHSHHNSYPHDIFHSATVQVTRSVPLGEHHSSTSGDWLIGFNPIGTTASPPFPSTPPSLSPPFGSKTISENSIEQPSKPPMYSGEMAPISHSEPSSPDSPSSPSTISSTASATSIVEPSAKRATLRDILSTDCPDAEDQGYCDSPPRYPTQQVNAVLRQCADLVELLHAPLPDVLSDDPTSVPGEEPVCPSTRQMLRPGYVRDTASGRWFVAVQSRGRLSQFIPSEKCNAAGKSCARLAESKCARNIGFRNGVRASACRQKWTMRSILTWDPDRPARCPQMTMVKLPDTCVCRLLPSGFNETTYRMDR